MKLNQITGSNLSELLRGGFTSLLFKVLGIAAGYLFFILMSRWFGAFYVGLFSISWTLLMIGSVTAKWGIDTAIVRFISESKSLNNASVYKSYIRKSFSVILFFSIITVLAGILLSSFLKKTFYSPGVETYYIILTCLCILPFSAMSFLAEYFRGLKNILYYSVFQSGSIYVIVIIITFIIYHFFSKNFYLFESLTFSLLFLSLLALILFKTQHKNTISTLSDNKSGKTINYRQILTVSTPMLLTNSLYLIMSWTDILMIGYFEDEAQAGIYNAAVKTAALGSVAIAAVNSIAAPKFAEIFHKNDKKELKNIVKQSSLLSFVLSFPVFLIIFVFPEFLLGFFGDDFLDAKLSLLFLAIGQLVNTFSGSTLYLLNMTGKEKQGRNILAFGAVLNVLLNFILIPRLGISGAALATMCSTVFWNTLAVLFIYRQYGFLTYPFKSFK